MRYVRNETNGGNRMEGETIERYSLDLVKQISIIVIIRIIR